MAKAFLLYMAWGKDILMKKKFVLGLISLLCVGTTCLTSCMKDVTKHTVNFYVEDDLVYKTTVEDGGMVAEPDKEQLQGYTVNSWYSKEEGGYRWLFGAYCVSSDLNLYAGEDWTGKEYTITLDPGQGTLDTKTLTVTYNAQYELPTPTASMSNDGIGLINYAFDGWYLNDTLIPQSGIKWIYSDTDVTLVAKYYALDYVSFSYGIYPQTHVSDETLIASLNTLTTTEPNGWYLYDGDYYANLIAKPYGSNYTFNDGTTIKRGTEYWFKCDPISWDILESNDGEYKLVSSVILDAHCYCSLAINRTIDGKTVHPNNYKYSDIRTWLNDDFYNSAFSLGNSYIQTVEVDNSAATTSYSKNSYACENTNDNVYLLSYQDYMNTQYFADDASRCCETTDYAKANGCYANKNVSYLNNGMYWTRSPSGDDSYYASSVLSDSRVYNYSSAYHAHYGVRPALTIKIK